jgi:hypothetical protein
MAMLWFDPLLKARDPRELPSFTHFENMGIVCARSAPYTGHEALLTVKCGAPLGKHAHDLPPGMPKHGDVGHVHPDANHFILMAGGEYIFKNNGYVKRITRYHSTLLIDSLGQWGEKKLYFDPTPLDSARDPRITEARSTPAIDYITGDASRAYMDAGELEKFTRRFIFLKRKSVLLIVDRVETRGDHSVQLGFFPEHTPRVVSPEVLEWSTVRNSVRMENLTPEAMSMSVGEEGVQERHGERRNPTPLVTLAARAGKLCQITAISWSRPAESPARVRLDGEGCAVIDDEKIRI